MKIRKVELLIVSVIITLYGINLSAQNTNNQKFKFAKSFEQAGDFKTSSRIYKELFEANPKKDSYFFGLVKSLKELNQFSDILPIIEKKLKYNRSTKILNIYAEMLWRLGKPDKANDAWYKAIDLSKNIPKAYKEISNTMIELRQFQKAIDILELGRKNLNNKSAFADELSKLFIATGDFKRGTEEVLNILFSTRNIPLAQGRLSALMTSKEAKQYIANVMEDGYSDYSDNFLFLKIYAWYLRINNHLEKALEVIKNIDKIMNAQGREVINFAHSSRTDGQYDIALKAYQYVISFGKKSRYFNNALYGYPRTLEQKLLINSNLSEENAKNIIEYYENIVKELPGSSTAADARYRIANIFINYLQDMSRAKQELELISKKFSHYQISAKATNLLGSIYILENNLNAAQNTFNIVIRNYKKFKAEYLQAKYSIAQIEFYKGNIDTAKVLFGELAIQSNTDVANDALDKISIITQHQGLIKALKTFAQSELLEKQRKFNLAIKSYDKTAEFSKGTELAQRCLIHIAELEITIQQYDSANIYLNKLLTNYTKSIYRDYAFMLQGNCYMNLGQKDKAKKSYQNLLIKFPRSIYAQQARDNIEKLRLIN